MEDSHCDKHNFQIGLVQIQPPTRLSLLVTEKFLQIEIRGVILNTRPTRHVLGKKKNARSAARSKQQVSFWSCGTCH